MKTIFLIIVMLVSSASKAAAQIEKCTPALSNAPTLLNLRLGMSPKEARNVFGGKLKIKVKKEGSFFQNYIEKKPPPFLPNIRALYLRFFEAKLYQIEIFYELQNQKTTLEEFTDQLSAQLNLPPNLWTTEYGKAKLDCTVFSLVADNVLNPRVELTDEIIRARFEAAQANKNK
ncbi:MAG: hypothetical protein ACR2MG_13855 [Pyrinomonadaceae bacterium]